MTTLHEALRDAVIAQLKPGYDLTYVDQGDKLGSDQISMVVAGDWPGLWSSNEEWEYENRHGGALYEIKGEVEDVIKTWEVNNTVNALIVDGTLKAEDVPEDFEYDTLFDEFEDTPEWDEVLDAIKQRDTSDVWKDLAHKSGRVLMRQIIVNEDGGWAFERVTPTDVIKAFQEWAEEGTVLKRNAHNLKVARDVLRECSPEFSVLLGMIVYAVDVGDLYDMGDVEYVDIVNPYLYLGNPFAGSGYCEGPLKGSIRIKREELTTDRGAFGYGWDEVAGVYTSAYDAEIKAVPKEDTDDGDDGSRAGGV